MKQQILAIFLAASFVAAPMGMIAIRLATIAPQPPYTIDDRLRQFGTAARTRLRPYFERAQVLYPPQLVQIAVLKQERKVLLYAAAPNSEFRYILGWPIVAAAGGTGPKRREGDRQVPEGLYNVDYLNPNSVAFVSLKISYPNKYDQLEASPHDARNLGGDIMIHGRTNGTRGCVALDNQDMADLFTIIADTGVKNAKLIFSPRDFRTANLIPGPHLRRYQRIYRALSRLPSPLQTWKIANTGMTQIIAN